MKAPGAQFAGGLFARHMEEIRRFLRHSRAAPDADDLVQEGFVRLLQCPPERFPDNPRAWLFRTCSNLASDARDYRRVREAAHGRRATPAELDAVAAPALDPAARSEAQDQLLQVWRALQSLPAPCRRAFLLNRLDGMSQRQIAAHLGLSEKTVERHVLRALAACHAVITEQVTPIGESP